MNKKRKILGMTAAIAVISKKKIFQYEKQYKCDLHEKTHRDYIFNIPCNGMYSGRAGGYPSQDTIPKH